METAKSEVKIRKWRVFSDLIFLWARIVGTRFFESGVMMAKGMHRMTARKDVTKEIREKSILIRW